MFTKKAGNAVCELLESGKSLRASAKEIGVDPATVLKWTKQSDAFAQQYTSAREIGYALLSDQMIEIADESRIGIKRTTKANGDIEEVEVDMVERARLQLDTRKWMLSKMLPKVYGDKTTTAVVGADGETLPTTIGVMFISADGNKKA